MKFFTLHSSSFCLGLVLAFTAHSNSSEDSNSPATSEAPIDVTSHNTIALSPEEAIAGMELKEGYGLETVLAEPLIAEPVLVVFDANGRMYVAEMRTYMQDIDANGQFDPISHVSMHEDTNGDGNYDRHTVFADSLMLPRVILPLDDRIIIGETNTEKLYSYRDTDGDGVADEKKLWLDGGERDANLEHQSSGLIWGMDNNIYQTRSNYRLRIKDGVPVKESIPKDEGQWGLTQDDHGKVWYVDAGGERGPVHFQQHILYGAFDLNGQYKDDFKEVWPIDNIPDTQGGRFQLRPDNTLTRFTATCGQDIFRGNRLPEDLRGDLLFAEPVGRLIRRTEISIVDGMTQLSNAYDKSEFIRSADPLFRPVNMVTAPDGTLYIVDMYRGIIQEGQWTREGSYLREAIKENDLEKEIGRGRVYRLVHEDFEPSRKQPRMLDETPAQLVRHLSHPNGWWRDTAQKLIVLRGDTSVVPALKTLFAESQDLRTQAHALWTVDGLGEMDAELLFLALNSNKSSIQAHAIRLAESFLEESNINQAVLEKVKSLLESDDPTIVIQAMASLKKANIADAELLSKETADNSEYSATYAINEQLWKKEVEDPYLISQLGPNGLKSYRRGQAFYRSICITCHGEDGLGVPSVADKTIAPPLAGSNRLLTSEAASIKILLHGLQGAIDGVEYGSAMIPMGSYSDEKLADVITYVGNSFGNRAPVVEPSAIAEIRKQHQSRVSFWTMDELEAEHPKLLAPRDRFEKQDQWIVSASHNNEKAVFAIDGDSETNYNSPSIPYPGQWFQIELPAKSAISSIIMDTGNKKLSFPESYEVHFSNNGNDWGEAVHSGKGEPLTRIYLEKPTTTRFIKITITDKTNWRKWQIQSLDFYGAEG
ncbi:discoidin domain-containing protein [Puniceicoccaceae bacterium K14]|nr:discoidin domain-containing protein [Puniceicoccaceae bacterium K14]